MKALEHFVADSRRKHGKGYRCKACHVKLNRDLRRRKGATSRRGAPPRKKWFFHPLLFKTNKS